MLYLRARNLSFSLGLLCPLQKRCSALEDSDMQFPGVDTGREGCGDRQSPDACDSGEGGFCRLLLRGHVAPLPRHSSIQNQGHTLPTMQNSGKEEAQEEKTKTQGQ